MRKFIAVAALATFTGALGYAAAPSTAAPVDTWTACVVHALTTDGMGSDAHMRACDAAYFAAVGDDLRPWLFCPGRPEDGGCRAGLSRPAGQAGLVF